MIKDIWILLTDPGFICLTLFVLWILAIQKRKRVEYYLAGRLANQHTVNNLLVNSISIADPDKQIAYLKFVAKFVKYGFNCQDKSSIPMSEEIEQVRQIVEGYEISNEKQIKLVVDIEPSFMNVAIIPFSIITILENALSYGMLDIEGNEFKVSVSVMENNLFGIEFSGYNLPSQINLLKSEKGHGLDILRRRLKFVHYDKNTNSVKGNRYLFRSIDGLSMKMILPK